MENKYYFKNDTKLTNYYMCTVKVDNLIFHQVRQLTMLKNF